MTAYSFQQTVNMSIVCFQNKKQPHFQSTTNATLAVLYILMSLLLVPSSDHLIIFTSKDFVQHNASINNNEAILIILCRIKYTVVIVVEQQCLYEVIYY